MQYDVVTGANGYLGSYLVDHLIKEGRNVICIVRAPSGEGSTLRESKYCRILTCPLERIEELPSLLPEGDTVDVCYHLAWCSGKKLRGYSIYGQTDLISQSLHLMDAVHQRGCKRFIGIGSILETGVNLTLPQHPNMIYAVTKDCTNKLLSLRARDLGLQFIWCRLCGIYGGRDRTGNLISYTVSCLKNGISPEYGEGQQPYSFVHVEDCAEILGRIGIYSGNVPHLLTIAGPESRSVREYMQILQNAMQVDTPLLFGKKSDDGIRYNADMFCNDWIVKTLGMQYRHHFAEEFRHVNDGTL